MPEEKKKRSLQRVRENNGGAVLRVCLFVPEMIDCRRLDRGSSAKEGTRSADSQ